MFTASTCAHEQISLCGHFTFKIHLQHSSFFIVKTGADLILTKANVILSYFILSLQILSASESPVGAVIVESQRFINNRVWMCTNLTSQSGDAYQDKEFNVRRIRPRLQIQH